MSQNDDDVRDESKRQLLKIFSDPIKNIAEGFKEEKPPEKIPRSYEDPEVARLLVSTGIGKDFDEELMTQWAGIQKAYRKMFPDNLDDFAFFLETDLYAVEVEEGKHRFCKMILEQFPSDTLKEMNDFFETELGQKVQKLSDTLRVELRNERSVISRNIGGRLEATTNEIKERKKV